MLSKSLLELKIIFEQVYESTTIQEEHFHCCWQNILGFFDKIIIKYKLQYFDVLYDSKTPHFYFFLASPI